MNLLGTIKGLGVGSGYAGIAVDCDSWPATLVNAGARNGHSSPRCGCGSRCSGWPACCAKCGWLRYLNTGAAADEALCRACRRGRSHASRGDEARCAVTLERQKLKDLSTRPRWRRSRCGTYLATGRTGDAEDARIRGPLIAWTRRWKLCARKALGVSLSANETRAPRCAPTSRSLRW